MKKFLALTLVLAMALSLAGCYSVVGMSSIDNGKQQGAVQEGDAFLEDAPPAEDIAPDWGLTLDVKDVTPKGLTLVIRQSGGAPTGDINTGTPYALKMRDGDTWVEVPMIRDDIAWNTIGYLVPMGGELEQNLNWSWMYGELDAGEYLLVKEFMDFRGAGDYDMFSFEVKFTVE